MEVAGERLEEEGCERKEVISGSSSAVKPQDADYSQCPSLSDEVEVMILARVPRSEYGKFSLVSRRHLSLLKTGELLKVRKEIGFREPSVFVLASGEESWWEFDRNFNSCRTLPILPSDTCFSAGDKETLSAGTQLIVSGKEIDGLVNWRYELVENKWYKEPSMKDLRCLFASATCGDYAYVAGGIWNSGTRVVLSSAERYNPETRTWERLPEMKRRRRLCSGCYLDGKFYVIGGRNEKDESLACGEFFDESRNQWDIVERMIMPIMTYQSPPLIAVVDNELYTLETSSNMVKLYLKQSNSWETLGKVPIRADCSGGWGVAFKSLGDELLVIGGARPMSYAGRGMCIYTCRPDPRGVEKLPWRNVACRKSRLNHFILNCCVMMA